MFEIIKGRPLPPTIRPAPDGTQFGPGRLYPFPQMEVGDCFEAPRDMGHTSNYRCARRVSVSSACSHYARLHGGKFIARIIDRDTVCCWRIA